MTEQHYEQLRRAMVSNQLRTTDVNDVRVLDAMGRVPRERFVPKDSAALAYVDRAVPLGRGRALNPPEAIGRMLSEAHPAANDRALVVGAGTGYAAALLAEMVASVVALEDDPALLAQARGAALSDRVKIVEGPLSDGWAADAPYDLIVVDGAIDLVPQALIDQLADGGRLVAAIMDNGVTRLTIGRRAGKGFGLAAFADIDTVALPGFSKPKSFSF